MSRTSTRRTQSVSAKLQLVDANGANVSADTIAVTATALVRLPANVPAVVQDAGNSSPGGIFRLTGQAYHFTLKTTGLANGAYALSFAASGDPVTHVVNFEVR